MHRSKLLHFAASACLPILASASMAAAAPVGPFDFETGSTEDNQYTQNFLVLNSRNNAVMTHTDPSDPDEPNNDYIKLVQTGSDIRVVAAINTNPVKTIANSSTFGGNLTLSFDLASNMPGGSTFGIYLFDPSSTNGTDNVNVMMQFNQSGETERIRFASDGNPTSGGSGTQYKGLAIDGTSGWLTGGDGSADTYWNATALPSTSEASQTWTSGSLVYTLGNNDDTTLTLNLGDFSLTWTIDNDLRVANPAVAFLFSGYGNSGASWRIDNISVVPEPTLIGLLPAAGLLALRRRRSA